MSKLEFELVPDGVWKDNLRNKISKEAWDFLKADAKRRAGGKCAICGAKTTRPEAHEKWSYDVNTKTQKLEDILSICKDCHSVIHIERTELKGDIERAENHYMKVNGCTYSEYRQARGKANDIHRELNKVDEWLLDLTFLKRYVEDETK